MENNMPGWIKCSDKLPPLKENVILYGPQTDTFVGYLEWHDKNWKDNTQVLKWIDGEYDEHFSLATHWMPLPDEPKDGG